MKVKYNKCISFLFVIALFVIGVVTIVLPDEEISDIENRTLVTFSSLDKTSYLDNSFQNTLENALIDQFFWRYPMVDFKNEVEYLFTDIAFSNTNNDRLLRALGDSGVMQIGNTNHMMDGPNEKNEERVNRVIERAQQMNALQQRNPDIQIVTYLPITAGETTLFDEVNGMTFPGAEYVSLVEQNINIAFDKFDVNSLEDIFTYFHTSDHHLNHMGLHQMYSDIMNLIGYPDEIKQPINENCQVGKTFYGTFSFRTGFILDPDTFCTYDYDIKPYNLYYEDEEIEKSGENDFKNYDLANQNEERPYYYTIAYSDDYEPIARYDFNQEEKPNVLLVGDSLSRAIIEVFASSFNHTYRLVPYDYYYKYESFNYDEFIEENDIDIVIFAYGLVNYYYKDEWGDRFIETSILDYGIQD